VYVWLIHDRSAAPEDDIGGFRQGEHLSPRYTTRFDELVRVYT
jgi:hypothetical protein